MPYLSVKGFNYYYRWMSATGKLEPSGRPVLVFIHGWGGSARYWESTVRTLTPEFDCLLAALGTMFAAVSQNAAEVMPQAFAKITVPTLLISGECDQIIPAALGSNAAKMSDRMEQLIIPNTAHFPMLEDPATYPQHVTAFLGIPTLSR